MTAALGSGLIKMVFWALGVYMKKQKQDQEFYESYMSFLEIANKKGYVKVANLIAGEDAYGKLKDRVKDRRENGETD